MCHNSILIFRHTIFLWLTGFTETPCFPLYNVLLQSFIKYLKLKSILCLKVVITTANRLMKFGAMSEKDTWLNCTIQLLARQFLDIISSLLLLTGNESKALFPL